MHLTRSARFDPAASAYDLTTIILHWLTALLVVVLFVLAQVWDAMPHGTPVRHSLQALHVSLGLLLTAVLVWRVVWRATGVPRLQPAATAPLQVAAQRAHYALSILLPAPILLGFLY